MTIADRLKPYRVAHTLIHRLDAYSVTEVPAFNPRRTMTDIAIWELLLDDDHNRLASVLPQSEPPEDPKAWLEEHRMKV